MNAGKAASEVLISIVVVTYNSRDDLVEFLPSIMSQSCTNYEVIVVDNASADGTIQYVKSNFPEVAIVESGSNLGYAGGNDIGFKHARGKYIAVVNPDTVVDKDWLSELIRPIEQNPGVDITTSKILMYDERGKINTCGNISHYTGLAFCRGLGQPREFYPISAPLGAISGCSFAIRREVLDKLGGFDQSFFLYLEDTDLSWRARLAGYHIQYAPNSIVYHKYSLSVASWKEFYLERNRYMMLLKNYRWKTLVLMSPPLMMTELVTWGHCIISGLPYVFNKLRAHCWIATHFPVILNKRREVQELRKISDREFLLLLDYNLPFTQVLENRTLSRMSDGVFNTFYRLYFNVLKRIV